MFFSGAAAAATVRQQEHDVVSRALTVLAPSISVAAPAPAGPLLSTPADPLHTPHGPRPTPPRVAHRARAHAMASAPGDGDIGEAAAAEATPARNKRTIYDYLGEGEDGEEASPPSPETPPRLRLPRFTCARIRFGGIWRKRGGTGGRKEAAAAEKSEDASVDSSGPRARDHSLFV